MSGGFCYTLSIMPTRPEINAHNYEAIYDYYEQSKLQPRLNAALFATCDKLYQPELELPNETREQIVEEVSKGKGVLMALNHPSQHDPFLAAGAMHAMQIHKL